MRDAVDERRDIPREPIRFISEHEMPGVRVDDDPAVTNLGGERARSE